jgi:dUTP diphosphatase
MNKVTVSVRPLPHFEGLDLPAYETIGSAGMDVRAAVSQEDPILLQAGERAMIPTGLSVAIPQGYEIQVRPRSGLAAKHGLTCLNTPGTIDSDYRGEIKVILINLGQDAFAINRGERIAQLVLAPVTQLAWEEVDALDETDRGAGGFGSTGR